ncbi:amino acid synthesis family protein [Jatrophihabitans lederbergiae]|uniref:Amino acid synthesis family protein n=1 Tax=Jatrophihabitans lederbergiae TaxID=3075547 RepID=A0ABU2JH67_9ACTN|nr:amino acid synthesis family protein [Jatrophihabitans sp. DSM 44399]MDT0264277.1 amino acid synthesis family protein [Jatrophihabitans sp. DSM 44399]
MVASVLHGDAVMSQPAPLPLALRKIVASCEQVLHENGTRPARSTLRAVASAVVTNPWGDTDAGRDLTPEVELFAPQLAKLLTDRLLRLLGGAEAIEAFGKGAIVGTAGEIEHGGALIHTPYFGNLVRDFLHGESIICFADARADAGQSLAVPMWNKTHAATRSHYQTITATIPDAPRADEIMVIVAASTGPRPHPRIGDRSTDKPISAAILEDRAS